MAGWHHRLNGRESEWTPGVGDGQGGLACCDSWGRKESDTTERLNWLTDWQVYLWYTLQWSGHTSVSQHQILVRSKFHFWDDVKSRGLSVVINYPWTNYLNNKKKVFDRTLLLLKNPNVIYCWVWTSLRISSEEGLKVGVSHCKRTQR